MQRFVVCLYYLEVMILSRMFTPASICAQSPQSMAMLDLDVGGIQSPMEDL